MWRATPPVYYTIVSRYGSFGLLVDVWLGVAVVGAGAGRGAGLGVGVGAVGVTGFCVVGGVFRVLRSSSKDPTGLGADEGVCGANGGIIGCFVVGILFTVPWLGEASIL